MNLEINIIAFELTSGNVDDRNRRLINNLVKKIHDLLFGDKGYIGLFDYLYEKGIKIIHGLKSNMQNKLVSLEEKIDLNKRSSVIETTIGILKDQLCLKHTRHRSPKHFFVMCFHVSFLMCFIKKENA